MNPLHFSIDLEAEIQKITQKQHLNRVHFLVQLVRHALTHEPKCIGIWSEKTSLEISQDGRSFNDEEWPLLKSLINQSLSEQDQLQAALTTLESRHGVAMLSLFMNFPQVQIETGCERLIVDNGQVHLKQTDNPVLGYRIRITRTSANPLEELTELQFYASGSKAPIYFNEKIINSPINFPNQILITRFKNQAGEGAVGIPEEDDLCSITYYKNGVRLGIKRFLPISGLVYHGYWNSGVKSFEADYGQSIGDGDRFIQHFSETLYREIVNHFPQFNLERKMRIKKLLLGLAGKQWFSHYGQIPLFHSGAESCALSLSDLIQLEKRYHGLPFHTRSARRGSPRFPKLLPEDIFFLRNSRKLQLKQLQQSAGSPIFKSKSPASRRVPAENLEPSQIRLLRALNFLDPYCIFNYTRKKSEAFTDHKGAGQVYLQIDHPLVVQALRQFRERPESVSVIKYQLLGLL